VASALNDFHAIFNAEHTEIRREARGKLSKTHP
jgi:hypothetical protein